MLLLSKAAALLKLTLFVFMERKYNRAGFLKSNMPVSTKGWSSICSLMFLKFKVLRTRSRASLNLPSSVFPFQEGSFCQVEPKAMNQHVCFLHRIQKHFALLFTLHTSRFYIDIVKFAEFLSLQYQPHIFKFNIRYRKCSLRCGLSGRVFVNC
jgi:hypothetical protein